jgi:hypothetical protein
MLRFITYQRSSCKLSYGNRSYAIEILTDLSDETLTIISLDRAPTQGSINIPSMPQHHSSTSEIHIRQQIMAYAQGEPASRRQGRPAWVLEAWSLRDQSRPLALLFVANQRVPVH